MAATKLYCMRFKMIEKRDKIAYQFSAPATHTEGCSLSLLGRIAAQTQDTAT